ncbi:MAG TPA: hypothetical protein ENK57_02995 [Polyangiaceae bacterium]|nr:hypothetical protein [Polyangiaceae bacterium]
MVTRRARATTATVVSLCRQRLRRRFGARVAWLLATLVAVIFGGVGAGADVGTDGSVVLGNAMRWLCWLGAGPLALSAALSPRARDRQDGVVALLARYGAGGARLTSGRFVAAAVETTLRILVPAMICCAMIAVAGRLYAGLVLIAGVLATSLIAGVMLGVVGAGCGLWGGDRGRIVLLALVILPWAVADQWAMPSLSVPGAIDAAIVFFVEGVV